MEAKLLGASGTVLSKPDAVEIQQHESEWNEILDGIQGEVDTRAFRDSYIDYDELDTFL